jgi:hypothetical protein
MTKKEKLQNELENFPPVTKYAVSQLQKMGVKNLKIKEDLQRFASYELDCYKRWFRRLSKTALELRAEPDSFAYQLVYKLTSGRYSPKQIIAVGKLRLIQDEEKYGIAGKTLELLVEAAEKYEEKCKRLRSFAPEYMISVNYDGLMHATKNYEKSLHKRQEDKLFQIQTIKHICNKVADGLEIPIDIYKVAIGTQFSADRKILDAQALMILSTWDYSYQNALLIKSMNYEFIRYVFTNIRSNYLLIDYLFKGDWISDQTRTLLLEGYDYIHKAGMTPVVSKRVTDFYRRGKLGEKSPEELSQSASWVIDLVNKYGLFK